MGKGMNWKGIGRLFVQMEDDEEGKKPAEETTEATPATLKPAEATIEVRASAGQQNANIAESLSKALEEANMPGFDYFEFAKTIEALKPTISAEQVLFQTAFASGSVMGATKEKLVEAAKHYLGVLSQKQAEFDQAVAVQTEETVTKKELAMTDTDQQIKAKAEQIQALTDEINALTSQRTEASNEISANKVKIEQVKNDFAATFQVFVAKIQKDIERIEKYLGTPTPVAPAK